MRIATAEYTHETNSFSSIKITTELMQLCKIDGTAFLHQSTGVHSNHGGLIAAAEKLGMDLIPTVFASFRPSGPAEKAVYEAFRNELVNEIWQAHQKTPLDAVALIAHGAGIADGYDDVEGDILKHLRDRLGDKIPISITLDLHGNISENMFNLSTFMIGCKEYPHTDLYEAAFKTIELLNKQLTPGKALRKLPMRIPSAAGCTLSGPGFKIKEYCRSLQTNNPDILDISVFHGFNAGNVPFAGVSVVTTAVTQELADHSADLVAAYCLSLEKAFIVPVIPPKEAVNQALASRYPVVINESTDNPGSGHPGDGTILLSHLLERDIPHSIFIGIHDPQVAAWAADIGVGGEISCLLGGKIDNKHGTPIEIRKAQIKAISNGKFICESALIKGAEIDLGTTALLQIGQVQVIVSSIRCQNFDDGPLRLFGLNWQDYSIIALKSLQHFRAWWTDKVKNIIPINAPPDKQYQ